MLDWPVFAPVVPMMRVAYHTGHIVCNGALWGQHWPFLSGIRQHAATLRRIEPAPRTTSLQWWLRGRPRLSASRFRPNASYSTVDSVPTASTVKSALRTLLLLTMLAQHQG